MLSTGCGRSSTNSEGVRPLKFLTVVAGGTVQSIVMITPWVIRNVVSGTRISPPVLVFTAREEVTSE